MRLRWTMLLVSFLLPGSLCADSKLQRFLAQNCVKCQIHEEENCGVRLDKPVDRLLADQELLKTITTLIEAGEMPPEEAPQPKAESVAEIMQLLQKRILTERPDNPLIRVGFTNTIRDLFGVEFDFAGLLPEHVEHGFDMFGDAHLMSPHQVMAYLKTVTSQQIRRCRFNRFPYLTIDEIIEAEVVVLAVAHSSRMKKMNVVPTSIPVNDWAASFDSIAERRALGFLLF